MIDATIVRRALTSIAPAQKKRRRREPSADPAADSTTKIARARRRPRQSCRGDAQPGPGSRSDLRLNRFIEAVDPGALIADKAFDADPFIAALDDPAIVPVIPSKSNRKTPRPCDFALYCERNLVERFFNKLKHFRAIATRYDKLAKIVLAGVHLACAAILLN